MLVLKAFLFVLVILGSSVANAAECSHLWRYDLSTDHSTPKGLSGDTSAAYALLGFRSEFNLKFIVQGRYPDAKFFSLESYRTRFLKQHDSIFDYNIAPYNGSVNPYQTGTFVRDQYYELEVLSDRARPTQNTSVLRMPSALLVQALMLRIFDPNHPLHVDDLPKVFAVDAVTGQERNCPRGVDIPFYLDFPQMIGRIAPRADTFKFGKSGDVSGGNTAIPGYMYTLTKIRSNDIGLVRFKAPMARYASLCIQNFLENQTLACLPDRLMKVDHNGFINVAFSEDHNLLKDAQDRGWNVLSFSRANNQAVFGIVYRNILPQQEPYIGEYAPFGVLCDGNDFLNSVCHIR